MEIGIITLIANTGGTLGLAIFAIWMLNRVWSNYLEAEKQRIVEFGELRIKNLDCLQQSSAVIAANTEVMRDNNEVIRRLLEVFNDLDIQANQINPSHKRDSDRRATDAQQTGGSR